MEELELSPSGSQLPSEEEDQITLDLYYHSFKDEGRLHEVTRVVNFIETESRTVVVGARGMGSYCVMDTEVGKITKFWRWTVVIVAQQCKCASCH